MKKRTAQYLRIKRAKKYIDNNLCNGGLLIPNGLILYPITDINTKRKVFVIDKKGRIIGRKVTERGNTLMTMSIKSERYIFSLSENWWKPYATESVIDIGAVLAILKDEIIDKEPKRDIDIVYPDNF